MLKMLPQVLGLNGLLKTLEMANGLLSQTQENILQDAMVV
jgi:hypothetical protein